MKYLHTIILVLIASFLFAQNGTSLEEYRYLTKGYAYQIEMGLDAQKNGYEITKLYTCKNNVKFSGLYSTDSGELKAIVAMLSPNTEQPKFICLPNAHTKPNVLAFYYKDKKALLPEEEIQFDAAMREWQFYQLGEAPSNNVQTLTDIPIQPEQTLAVEEVVETKDFQNELTAKGMKSIPKSYDQQEVSRIENPKNKKQKIMVDAIIQLDGISDRTIVKAPVIPEGIKRTDKIAVKICVDAEGLVNSAKYTMKGSTSMDSALKAIAVRSAKASRFSATNNKESCGIMTFSFGK